MTTVYADQSLSRIYADTCITLLDGRQGTTCKLFTFKDKNITIEFTDEVLSVIGVGMSGYIHEMLSNNLRKLRDVPLNDYFKVDLRVDREKISFILLCEGNRIIRADLESGDVTYKECTNALIGSGADYFRTLHNYFNDDPERVMAACIYLGLDKYTGGCMSWLGNDGIITIRARHTLRAPTMELADIIHDKFKPNA